MFISTENDDKTEDEYVLSPHLRDYFLLYVILFSIISITILCLICWYCTLKCFGTDKFNILNNKNGGKEGDDGRNIPDYGYGGGGNHSYNDLNLSTRVTAKDIGIEMDMDESDDNDDENAEFVMKAYDDDAHLKYKKGSSLNTNDEIQMISMDNKDDEDEYMTLKQKMDIQNAFDED